MRKKDGSRLGMMSPNSTKGDLSRKPQADNNYLGETCQSVVIQAPNNSNSSSDDEVEDETYVPSTRARPHGK
jgi:hypothetical protein